MHSMSDEKAGLHYAGMPTGALGAGLESIEALKPRTLSSGDLTRRAATAALASQALESRRMRLKSFEALTGYDLQTP